MSNHERVVQHSENVWSYIHNWERVEPAIGMILTSEGWIAVDGGTSPLHGRQIYEAMQQIAPQPVHSVILTHRHFDHSFGSQAFNAPVVSSQRCKERFEQNLSDDWGPDEVHNWLKNTMFPHIPSLTEEEFADLELISPSQTYSSAHAFDVGDTRIEFVPLEGVHTDDGIGIYLPNERVIFLGDAFYYLAPEGKMRNLPVLMDRVAELNAEIFVPGHERPHDRAVFDAMRDYIHTLLERIERLVASGASEADLKQIPFDVGDERLGFINKGQHIRLSKIAFREFAAERSA